MSILFSEDKTKSILFANKWRAQNIRQLNIEYNDINRKQHSKVTYLGCMLDEMMSGETRASKERNKINGKLKFLYRNNRFLNQNFE